MAARLRTATGAWVALGEKEVRRLCACDDLDLVLRSDREELTLWGVPADRLPEAAMDHPRLAHLQDLADPDLRLTDGALVPDKGLHLRVVTTPGIHRGISPGRCAARPDLQRGPRPAAHLPHIALELPGPANPLADYYDSLDLIGFEDAMEVCPAHEYRFRGMQRPVAQLIEHNRERSAEVLRVWEATGPRPSGTSPGT